MIPLRILIAEAKEIINKDSAIVFGTARLGSTRLRSVTKPASKDTIPIINISVFLIFFVFFALDVINIINAKHSIKLSNAATAPANLTPSINDSPTTAAVNTPMATTNVTRLPFTSFVPFVA